MDTTTAPRPSPAATGWWRRPIADLLDLTGILMVGATAGVAVGMTAARDAQDAWAELGAAIMGLAIGAVVAFVVWVALLVAVRRGRATPAARLLRIDAERPVLPTIGHHFAVVVAVWAALGLIGASIEPWPAQLGGGVAAGVGTFALLAAHGTRPWSHRLRVVGIATLVGFAITAAVPDRAPYPWEVRTDAEAALLTALEADPAARRACDGLAGPAGPRASHATAPCFDPDERWLVARSRDAVAAELLATATEAVGAATDVAVVHGNGTVEVHVDGLPVAIARHRQDCTTEVFLGRAVAPPTTDGAGVRCG